MKKVFIICFTFAFAMLSCKKTVITVPSAVKPMLISVKANKPEQGVPSRSTSLNGFDSFSQLGIYATLAPSSDLSTARNVNVGYGNPTNNTYWSALDEAQSIYYAEGDGAINLFSYHPYITQNGTTVVLDPLTVSPTLVYTLPLGQSSVATLVNADLMWGSAVNVKQVDGPAKLEFVHKLTKVTFNISKAPDWNNDEALLTDIKMYGAPILTSCRLEVSTGTLTTTPNQAGERPMLHTHFETPVSLSEIAGKSELIAIPVDDIAGVTLEFTVNGLPHTILINGTSIPDPANRSFRSGFNRIFGITVNKYTPEQVNVIPTIEPWAVVNEIDLDGI